MRLYGTDRANSRRHAAGPSVPTPPGVARPPRALPPRRRAIARARALFGLRRARPGRTPAARTGRQSTPVSAASPTRVGLPQPGPGTCSLRRAPGAAQRSKGAKARGLESLPARTAGLTLKAWRDGVEIYGRFDAVVE